MSSGPLELPEKWWSCPTCEVKWWGSPICWSCGEDRQLTMNARPRVGDQFAVLLVRPEWSTQP